MGHHFTLPSMEYGQRPVPCRISTLLLSRCCVVGAFADRTAFRCPFALGVYAFCRCLAHRLYRLTSSATLYALLSVYLSTSRRLGCVLSNATHLRFGFIYCRFFPSPPSVTAPVCLKYISLLKFLPHTLFPFFRFPTPPPPSSFYSGSLTNSPPCASRL